MSSPTEPIVNLREPGKTPAFDRFKIRATMASFRKTERGNQNKLNNKYGRSKTRRKAISASEVKVVDQELQSIITTNVKYLIGVASSETQDYLEGLLRVTDVMTLKHFKHCLDRLRSVHPQDMEQVFVDASKIVDRVSLDRAGEPFMRMSELKDVMDPDGDARTLITFSELGYHQKSRTLSVVPSPVTIPADFLSRR